MAGQVCFAHQIGQKGQEKLHNERHQWKLGGGTGIRGAVLQSGWACSTVVQSIPLPLPPSPLLLPPNLRGIAFSGLFQAPT